MPRRSGPPSSQEPTQPSPEVLRQSIRDYVAITLDLRGTIMQWNSGAQKIFGYTSREIIGRHFSILFTPEDRAAKAPEQELRNADCQPAEDQRWHLRKDGSRVFLSGTVCSLRNEAGEMTGYSKLARDITAQKLAELQKDALLERERAARAHAEEQWEILAKIASRLPACVGLVRLPDRVYAFANSTMCDALGHHSVVGKTPAEAHAGSAAILEAFDAAVRTGVPQFAPEVAVPSGGDRYFDFTFQPMPAGELPHDAVLIFAIDVTERVHARQIALRHSTAMEEQASLLDLAHDAILSMAHDGSIEVWNHGAEEMYGWARDQALGRNVHELLQTEFPLPLAEIEKALLAAGQWTGELKHRTRSGRQLEIWSRWVLRHHNGQPDGWLEVNRDITERKRLEAHLRDTQKMESLGVLAGGIAHDFNNLLVGILGNVSLAQELLPPSSPAIPLLQEAENASERAAHLTRQMLAYAGKGHMFKTDADLSRVVRDSLALVRSSIPPNIHLELDLAHRLPCINADILQLQQVATNLMLNSAEAIGEARGTITVRTSVEILDGLHEHTVYDVGTPAPGAYVVLEVEDTGPGIDPSVRPSIFDPFFTTKFTGRGLGLAAVSGIVRSLNGAIRVESVPHRRTCFRILFPTESAPPPPDLFEPSSAVL